MQNYSHGMRRTGSLRLALVAGVAFVLVGCAVLTGAAESRARDFVRTLISAPEDQARLAGLADLAPGQPADALLQGVGAQVAVSYLRATHRQGRRLDFSVISTTSQDDQTKIVIIAVEQRGNGALQLHRSLFRLRLQESAERGWLVTGMQAGD